MCFYGQRVQAPVHEFAQGMIHKPMLCHGAQTLKSSTRDPDPKVSTVTLGTSPGMTGMGGTFVKDLKRTGLQRNLQAVDQLLGCGQPRRLRKVLAHAWVSSDLR
jgi:hypothetical protein